MAQEIVDLTLESPPASPKTPTSPVQPPLVGSSSSSAPAADPAVMQNKHQPLPSLEQHDEQPDEPHPKRLRASSVPTMETDPAIARPQQPRLVRSSSESDVNRSGTQPVFDLNLQQGTCTAPKAQLTEAEQHRDSETDNVVGSDATPVVKLKNLGELIEYAKRKRRELEQSAADLPDQLAPSPVEAPPDPVAAPPVFAPLTLPFQCPPPMSAHAVHAPPLVVTASPEWMMPETLRLFPEEMPFFPLTSERGSSSSRVARDETNVDLSKFRDDYRRPKPRDWFPL